MTSLRIINTSWSLRQEGIASYYDWIHQMLVSTVDGIGLVRVLFKCEVMYRIPHAEHRY